MDKQIRKKMMVKALSCSAAAAMAAAGNVTPSLASVQTLKAITASVQKTDKERQKIYHNDEDMKEALISGNTDMSLWGSNITGTVYNSSVLMYEPNDGVKSSSSFSMSGGEISGGAKNIFMATNTSAEIFIRNTSLGSKAENLLNVCASKWGTKNANGASVSFTAESETLKGNILVDKLSAADVNLKNSVLEGSVNESGEEGSVSVILDKESSWKLTADSYVSALSCEKDSIDLNGHKLYVNGEKYKEGAKSKGYSVLPDEDTSAYSIAEILASSGINDASAGSELSRFYKTAQDAGDDTDPRAGSENSAQESRAQEEETSGPPEDDEIMEESPDDEAAAEADNNKETDNPNNDAEVSSLYDTESTPSDRITENAEEGKTSSEDSSDENTTNTAAEESETDISNASSREIIYEADESTSDTIPGNESTAAQDTVIEPGSEENTKDPSSPSEEAEESVVNITLSEERVTVNGQKAEEDTGEDVYVTTEDNVSVIHIVEAGTYRITGKTSSGAVSVDLPEVESSSSSVKLILNNADITNPSGSAIMFNSVYECGGSSNVDEAAPFAAGNTVNAGAKIVLAAGSKNTVNSISSNESMDISSEGDGAALYVNSSGNGITSKMNLTFRSGSIFVKASKAGICVTGSGSSRLSIKDGMVHVISNEDAITSAGYTIIEGGNVIAAGGRLTGNGISGKSGLQINGGNVIAAGKVSSMIPSSDSTQASMVFQFKMAQAAGTPLVLTDKTGNYVFAYNPNDDTDAGDDAKQYQQVLISSENIREGSTYALYLGGTLEGSGENGLYKEVTGYTGGIQQAFLSRSVFNNADEISEKIEENSESLLGKIKSMIAGESSETEADAVTGAAADAADTAKAPDESESISETSPAVPEAETESSLNADVQKDVLENYKDSQVEAVKEAVQKLKTVQSIRKKLAQKSLTEEEKKALIESVSSEEADNDVLQKAAEEKDADTFLSEAGLSMTDIFDSTAQGKDGAYSISDEIASFMASVIKEETLSGISTEKEKDEISSEIKEIKDRDAMEAYLQGLAKNAAVIDEEAPAGDGMTMENSDDSSTSSAPSEDASAENIENAAEGETSESESAEMGDTAFLEEAEASMTGDSESVGKEAEENTASTSVVSEEDPALDEKSILSEKSTDFTNDGKISVYSIVSAADGTNSTDAVGDDTKTEPGSASEENAAESGTDKKADQSASASSVQTGDGFNKGMIAGLISAAGAAIGAVIFRKRRL